MHVAWRLLLKFLVCLLAGFAACCATAAAEGSSALGGTDGSPLESPLVVPEARPLLGGEAVTNAEEARRASPEAVVVRQESQTEYEGLSAGEASKLAGEAFPGVVDHPAGGLPQLPEGQRITSLHRRERGASESGAGWSCGACFDGPDRDGIITGQVGVD